MSDASLQFEKAEFTRGAAPSSACAFCQQPLRHNYWSVDGKAACARCKDEVATRGTGGSGLARFVRATVFGSFAGALGAGLWYAIRAVTNLEIGLISIVVGLAVGVAVKAGCHGRGGPLYQALAMFLTYTAICSTYVPYIIDGFRQGAPAEGPIALVLVPILVTVFAYAAPFLGGFQSILGLAIIGFGVYEAWKINRRETHAIGGPFAVAAPSGAVPESAGPPALG